MQSQIDLNYDKISHANDISLTVASKTVQKNCLFEIQKICVEITLTCEDQDTIKIKL